MDIIRSEEYEILGNEFQCQVISVLKDTLKKNQIDEAVRKEICGYFIFKFSMLLDQGDVNGTSPQMTFVREDKIFLKNEQFDYHEYAFGNVDEVFDTK